MFVGRIFASAALFSPLSRQGLAGFVTGRASLGVRLFNLRQSAAAITFGQRAQKEKKPPEACGRVATKLLFLLWNRAFRFTSGETCP
jgi:hypothetical protein